MLRLMWVSVSVWVRFRVRVRVRVMVRVKVMIRFRVRGVLELGMLMEDLSSALQCDGRSHTKS